ncbi:hypothetical protein BX661DRAFT_6155 [Kickxella alabastrina]|uniref:uncharacterized protein n=1 Tax=Kickxella alabastrina TaxID=61397 RepID=UPI00221E8397|nr:uncharacterized protein BX661DRAFT_6155 [Kickxella alabastrina]KAI7834894.1 hypothetical protein BX661DRAFT_6155 [Kickxella alabastrina]KAJ1947935.1 hypothetical protein GGF37_000082 [Kickxella alabastrina]
MDVNVYKRPLPLNGVQWSIANRCIIGTSSRVFIVSPQLTIAGEIPVKREVSATIEMETDIEAISLLENLPSAFPYSNAIAVLTSHSSVRLLASRANPNASNWTEVARHQFGSAGDHVCAISSCVVAGSDDQGAPVVACGTVSGNIEFLRVNTTHDSDNSNNISSEDSSIEGANTGGARMEVALRLAVSNRVVAYMAWLTGAAPSNDGQLLVSCAIDGTTKLWLVSKDVSQAQEVSAVVSKRDWRPVTSHASTRNIAVLAKLGTAIIVDIRPSGSYQTQCVPLGISQTLISCVIDEDRGRIYVGSHDFVVFVLACENGKWSRAYGEEAPMRDALRKTVIQSFTTKFNMKTMFLRGMTLSPNGRYLEFVADDQINWDLEVDGLGITRIHHYQFPDWSTRSAERSLMKIINGEYQGVLKYNLWDVLNNSTIVRIREIVEFLQQIDTMFSASEDMKRQHLAVLNYIGCVIKVSFLY